MALHDQRINESPIFFNSIEGLQVVLGRVAVDYGQPPIPVAVVQSTFAQREISEKYNGQITYPFMAISLQQISRNMVGYNNNLQRDGVSVTHKNKVYIYRLIPIIASFRVRYFCQDSAQLMNFSKRWLLRKKDMQFKLANDSLDINIRVRPSDDLNVPDEDVTDWGNIFQLETSCEIESYIGDIETTTKITSVQLTTNLLNNAQKKIVESSNIKIKLPNPII